MKYWHVIIHHTYGELDIIALDNNINPKEIVFVEVKTRKQLDCGMPAESVTYRKIKHIYNTAQYYLNSIGSPDAYSRFDIIEIVELDNKNIYLNHIKHAIDDFSNEYL